MKLSQLLKWDFKFQYKYGIINVAIILLLMYLALIYFTPKSLAPMILPISFITDFGVTSFIFVSAMIFFEKGEGTIYAIVTSPIKVSEYIKSKIISLSFTIMFLGFALAIGGAYFKDIETNYIYVFLGAILTCSFFILLGIISSTYFKSFTDVLLPMSLLLFILFIPFLNIFNIEALSFMNYIYWIWPTHHMIKIIQGVYSNINIFIVLFGCIYVIFINYMLYKIAIRKFNKNIIGRAGDIDE